MKIGIISDSPTVTTGFGITTNQIAHALAAASHDVVCLGLKALGETFDRTKFPFKIWTVGVGGDWATLLSKFLAHERLDAILINMDIFNLKEWLTYCAAVDWNGPVIAYLILDGFPAYREYLEMLSRVQMVIATTQAGARYLRECGISVADVIPPGVDPAIFFPLSNRELLRQEAGLADKFVIGVFGRNTDRKQQVRVLTAFSHLRQMGKDSDMVLYFHCQPKAYWNLDEIAEELEIENSVIFADDGQLDETAGAPYTREGSALNPEINRLPKKSKGKLPRHYSYVERMNCCDLIVNVSHCGDFEQVIIEAQSCGIPIAATDDQGIMAEAMGDGGILLAPIDVSFWKAGQRKFLVSPHSIAEAILSVKEDEALRAALREKGMNNARKYSWDILKGAMVEAIAHL